MTLISEILSYYLPETPTLYFTEERKARKFMADQPLAASLLEVRCSCTPNQVIATVKTETVGRVIWEEHFEAKHEVLDGTTGGDLVTSF